MSSVLRACVSSQTHRYLQESASFSRSVTCYAHNSGNFKKFAPVLQIRHTSTKDYRTVCKPSLIYNGELTNDICYLKLFSLSTTAGMLLIMPIIALKILEGNDILVLVGIASLVLFIAVGNPLIIHLIAKRYVTHMYYYPLEDSYAIKTYSLFFQLKEIEFTLDDVIIPTVPKRFTCCTIKGHPLFFEEDNFTDVKHYFNIMGHYKPIDFKLNDNTKLVKKGKENGN